MRPVPNATPLPAAPTVSGTEAREPPADFVDLARLAPTIHIAMRYATADNFVGRQLPGYRANRCLLRRPAADALARAQKALEAAEPGLVLVVFDCYRPRRAVAAMMDWTRHGDGRDTSSAYHPRVARGQLVANGYIAPQSTHSRGLAVDLTLARRTQHPATPAQPAPSDTCATTGREPVAYDGVTLLDMGTPFDCFDPASATGAATSIAARNRRLLLRVLQHAGFRNFAKEWWHFSYPGATGERLDFEIR